jgi:two-component sensor histidine kinase
MLPVAVTQTLAMVLHELAMNAVPAQPVDATPA